MAPGTLLSMRGRYWRAVTVRSLPRSMTIWWGNLTPLTVDQKVDS